MQCVVFLTRAEWEDSATKAEQDKMFVGIREWYGKLASSGKMAGGHQLEAPRMAKTIIIGNKGAVRIADGPFTTSDAPIGGYTVLNVADLNEAVEIFRSFPAPNLRIELRPVLER